MYTLHSFLIDTAMRLRYKHKNFGSSACCLSTATDLMQDHICVGYEVVRVVAHGAPQNGIALQRLVCKTTEQWTLTFGGEERGGGK